MKLFLFVLQPFLGNHDSVNQISGKIKLGKEVLAFLEGHWVSSEWCSFINSDSQLRQVKIALKYKKRLMFKKKLSTAFAESIQEIIESALFYLQLLKGGKVHV